MGGQSPPHSTSISSELLQSTLQIAHLPLLDPGSLQGSSLHSTSGLALENTQVAISSWTYNE